MSFVDKIMISAGLSHPSSDDRFALSLAIDFDGSGFIDFDEFLEFSRRKRPGVDSRDGEDEDASDDSDEDEESDDEEENAQQILIDEVRGKLAK